MKKIFIQTITSLALFSVLFVGAWMLFDISGSVNGSVSFAQAAGNFEDGSDSVFQHIDGGGGGGGFGGGCGGCGGGGFGGFGGGFGGGGFGGGGGGGGFTPPTPPPPAPFCALDLTKDAIFWTTAEATTVTILPLTNSPAVAGASTNPGTAPGTTLFSGDFGNFIASNRAVIQQDLAAHGGPFVIDGFFANTLTADRLCSTVFPGSVSGPYQTDTYKTPHNNTVLMWMGSSWLQRGAKGFNSHFRNTFTCVVPSGGGVISPLSGSHTFIPPLGAGTHTYKLTATGPGGTDICQATVVVPPPPPPPPPGSPVCSLLASPDSLTPGNTSLLTWTTGNAVSFEINQGFGAVTPIGEGATTTPALTSTTTFTGTAKNANGDTVTCSATVSVGDTPPPPPPPPPPPGPACTLVASASSIKPGESIELSWTSLQVTSGFINNNVGTTSPVAAGSQTVFPSDDTLYTGTFTGPEGQAVCSVTVSIEKGGGGCTSNCGGGLNQPNVVLFNAPNEQPLAFVSLSQIPYTGFAAGPLLSFAFWGAVVLWSFILAYIFIGKESMRYLARQIFFGGAVSTAQNTDEILEQAPSEDTSSLEQEYFAQSVEHESAPHSAVPEGVLPNTEEPATLGIPALASVLESRAHAAGVLLSPEALQRALALAPERAETLRLFGDVLNKALQTIPREDGWILLSSEKMTSLMQGITKKKTTASNTPLTPFAPSSELIVGSVAERIVRATLSGNRDAAFSLVRDLEQSNVNPTKVVADIIKLCDRLYQARKDNAPLDNVALQEKMSSVSLEKIHTLATLFAGTLETTYALPYTGLKIALAEAFDNHT